MDAAVFQAEATIQEHADESESGTDDHYRGPLAEAVRDPKLYPDPEPPGPDDWHDLSQRDQRLVQQLINRLRTVEDE